MVVVLAFTCGVFLTVAVFAYIEHVPPCAKCGRDKFTPQPSNNTCYVPTAEKDPIENLQQYFEVDHKAPLIFKSNYFGMEC